MENKKKNSGCINCASCNKKDLNGAACYECGNKKAWKKVVNAIFGIVKLNMCSDLNNKLDCPYFKQNKTTTVRPPKEITGGTGKNKFIQTTEE